MIETACAPPAWNASALQAELPRHVLTGAMRYTDFTPLGYGGKAKVCRCNDATLGRQVAFKVLHDELMANQLEQQMLVREARIMASLEHRAVPVVLDLGRDQQARPYFTMTLIEGRTLHEILTDLRQDQDDTRPRYGLEELVDILMRSAEALQYVHRQGVVHGDVKPENLIIGHDGIVRIVDWGLATIDANAGADANSGETRGEKRIEELWGCQGSALYMSPEQVTRKTQLTPASDVFSLGVVLYECLTLQSPLCGPTTKDTLRMVLDSKPERPSAVAPTRRVPAELEQVCMRAMAKSPSDRFESMAELCQQLRDCHLDLLVAFERDELVA